MSTWTDSLTPQPGDQLMKALSGLVIAVMLAGCSAAPDAQGASPTVRGTVSAMTSASPTAVVLSVVPVDFRLPTGCAYMSDAIQAGNGYEWRVDCGVDGNRDARGTLGRALTAQGWMLCSMVTATGLWAKANLNSVVVETSGSPGDYIRFGQHPKSQTCP